MLIKLNKNIQKSFSQTLSSQLLIISTASLNEMICERYFQNESENVIQKLMQNKNYEKHFQTFSS